MENMSRFTGCGTTQVLEGYGLQAVHNQSGTSTALAAEGWDLTPNPLRPAKGLMYKSNLRNGTPVQENVGRPYEIPERVHLNARYNCPKNS
jgi:hypothetical protein